MKNLKSLLTTLLLTFGLLFLNSAIANESSPQYSDYPAVVMCKSKTPLKLDFSNNQAASAFRARLQAAAQQEPNFAGHYILTSWGCGTFCRTLAVIDTLTGKIYMPEIAGKSMDNYLVGWGYESPSADSKLLVVNAQLTTTPRSQPGALKGPLRDMKVYYKWENNQLVRLQ